MKRFISFIILFLTLSNGFSQLGGLSVYEFLNMPYSARSAALGTNMIPVMDKDITLGISNPSLINPKMHNHVNFGYTNYLADVSYGNVAYARSIDTNYTGMFSIQYINYGDFIHTDEFGKILGEFKAADYSFNLGGSRKLTEKWYAGASLKFIYSSYEDYTSTGLATDLGITYTDEEKILTTTLVVNNLGFQLQPYANTREPLPLNIQWGISKKLLHMPLRFIMVTHHLNVPDFTYYDPYKQRTQTFDNFGDEPDLEEEPFSEKLFRHFVFAGEFVFTENFHARIGYNYQRRKELSILERKAGVGFSWGFGMRISKFHIAYGWAKYHVAGASNQFSMTVNLSEFIKKK
jgi:hypothetical protein